jgi:predicted HTH domain antitoxin
MTISFELPQNIEKQARTHGADLNREAKVAYLVELHRQERITRVEVSEALDLGFHHTEQLLKEHGVGDDYTLEEFQAERAMLREAGPR